MIQAAPTLHAKHLPQHGIVAAIRAEPQAPARQPNGIRIQRPPRRTPAATGGVSGRRGHARAIAYRLRRWEGTLTTHRAVSSDVAQCTPARARMRAAPLSPEAASAGTATGLREGGNRPPARNRARVHCRASAKEPGSANRIGGGHSDQPALSLQSLRASVVNSRQTARSEAECGTCRNVAVRVHGPPLPDLAWSPRPSPRHEPRTRMRLWIRQHDEDWRALKNKCSQKRSGESLLALSSKTIPRRFPAVRLVLGAAVAGHRAFCPLRPPRRDPAWRCDALPGLRDINAEPARMRHRGGDGSLSATLRARTPAPNLCGADTRGSASVTPAPSAAAASASASRATRQPPASNWTRGHRPPDRGARKPPIETLSVATLRQQGLARPGPAAPARRMATLRPLAARSLQLSLVSGPGLRGDRESFFHSIYLSKILTTRIATSGRGECLYKEVSVRGSQ